MLHDLSRIPVLTTERLVLRGFRADDLGAFAAMLADPAVGAPKGFPAGADRGQAWAGLANVLGHWALRGFGLFAVTLGEDGTFVGAVGLIAPEGWPAPEATWTIARPHQGRGYAREAAAAVRDHGFHALRLERIVSFVPPGNEPSRRVAAAIGMRAEGTVRVFGDEAEMWVVEAG
ncbi:GNAT family N-acetyltransferase [Salinarimonas ramus]|uniref:N-acetyltransferase n=1 Tax=Salinarimonas ramus TaxID=690164 RepID=A0A917Q5E9_9HYPH|nr:GNAT family N-acetyltransferase [Salinarimonas ramus]GGK25541.1 N-acetyltransferase [Salinarimonas ramus]